MKLTPLSLAAVVGLFTVSCGTIPRGQADTENRREICSNQRPPNGWIKIDHYTSSRKCNPSPFRINNVQIIERYSNKRVGDEMWVCSMARIPTGWRSIRTQTSSRQCYTRNTNNNIRLIRRIR